MITSRAMILHEVTIKFSAFMTMKFNLVALATAIF